MNIYCVNDKNNKWVVNMRTYKDLLDWGAWTQSFCDVILNQSVWSFFRDVNILVPTNNYK